MLFCFRDVTRCDCVVQVRAKRRRRPPLSENIECGRVLIAKHAVQRWSNLIWTPAEGPSYHDDTAYLRQLAHLWIEHLLSDYLLSVDDGDEVCTALPVP
jgi:hypothetical protein